MHDTKKAILFVSFALGVYAQVPDGIYTFVAEKKTWPEARAYCENMGQRLATICNAEENAKISEFMSSDIGYLWVGLNDLDTEGTFEWDSGSSCTYRNWGPGEPTNTNGFSDEHCTHVFRHEDLGNIWNDGTCDSVMAFVCEREGSLYKKLIDWEEGYAAGDHSPNGQQGCYNLGCYTTHDEGSDEARLEECQHACDNTEGCNVINFIPRGADGTSGEGRCCRRECVETPTTTNGLLWTNWAGWDVYEVSAGTETTPTTPEPCSSWMAANKVFLGIEYPRSNPFGHPTREDSYTSCAERCGNTYDCVGWSMRQSRKLCYLKHRTHKHRGQDLKLVSSDDFFSGSPACSTEEYYY